MGSIFESDGLIHDITDPGDLFGARSAKAAQELSADLGYKTLDMQQDWLDYMKGEFEPYSAAGQRALAIQEQMLPVITAGPNFEAAAMSPDYKMLKNEARNQQLAAAEATGGLGSTSTQNALGASSASILSGIANRDYQNLLQGFDAYGAISGKGLQGSQGIGTFGGNTLSGMAGTMSGIGTGALNSAAMQQQQGTNLLGMAAGLMSMFSDIRLKKNIQATGEKSKYGHEIYTWDWNEEAERNGLKGSGKGVIADHVEQKDPSAVSVDEKTGYKKVNYARV